MCSKLKQDLFRAMQQIEIERPKNWYERVTGRKREMEYANVSRSLQVTLYPPQKTTENVQSGKKFCSPALRSLDSDSDSLPCGDLAKP